MGVEEDFEDEYDEEEEYETGSSRKRKAGVLNQLDDVEEDEEDDDDEGGEVNGGGGGRRGRNVESMFFDLEAGVDGDEEEEYDEDDDELIVDKEEDLPEEEVQRTPSVYRTLPDVDGADEDPEALAAYLNQRYQTQQVDQGEATATTQQSLLPTLKDPKLWVVQCRPGCEKQLCIQLLNKYHAAGRKGTPLLIKSAVCLDHLKGYFYVEAEKESYVREAVSGLRNMFMSKGVKLVPLVEMVDAITVNKNAKLAIERGSWVRVRSGPYAGDLAKVVEVDLANQKVTVKVIPRIDYQELANREEGRGRRGFPFGRGQSVRPAAKPFSIEEARSLDLPVHRIRGHDGEIYLMVDRNHFQNGYLIKTLALRSIVPQEAVPPLEELQRFNAAGMVNNDDANDEEMGLSSMLEALPGGRHGLKKGDEVIVTKGDLNRLTGTISEIKEDGKVSVKLNHEELKDALVFEPTEVSKYFQVGDHVRVDGGEHEGEMGMVIKVEGLICRVMSESTKRELKVYSRDLCKTEQSHVGFETLGEYELHDLVELENNNFGVIVFVDKDFCKVLMAEGTPDKPEVRMARLVDIRRKTYTRRNMTNDVCMNRVGVGDVVDIVNGPMRGRHGTVEYIIKGYLFLKCRDVVHNLGFVSVSARSCRVRGGKRTGRPIVDARTPSSSQNPRTPAYQPMSPQIGMASPGPFSDNAGHRTPMHGGLTSPRHSSSSFSQNTFADRDRGRGFGGRFGEDRFGYGGGRGRGRGRSMVGETVRVIKGPNRGYRGRVRGETPTHIRLELEANCRVVTVPKGNIEGGEGVEMTRRRIRPRMEATPSTPWHAPKTPLHPGASPSSIGTAHPMTPIHPSMTPLHPGVSASSRQEGSRTPSHQPSWNLSPAVASPAREADDNDDDDDDDDDGLCFGNGPTAAPYTPARTPAMPSPAMLDNAPTPAPDAAPPTYSDSGNEEQVMIANPPSTTPGMGAAMTPALTPGVTPGVVAQTPGIDGVDGHGDVGGENSEEAVDPAQWENLVVKLPDDKHGVVNSVSANGMCGVELVVLDEGGSLSETGTIENHNVSVLVPVQPQKRDHIRVLDGEYKGMTGKIMVNDGNEVIVKWHGSVDIKIMDINLLGRLKSGPEGDPAQRGPE